MNVSENGKMYYFLSPYAYCSGNPVNLVDRKGEDWYQFYRTAIV